MSTDMRRKYHESVIEDILREYRGLVARVPGLSVRNNEEVRELVRRVSPRALEILWGSGSE